MKNKICFIDTCIISQAIKNKLVMKNLTKFIVENKCFCGISGKSLSEVQWRLENNSEKDGLYQFEFLMKHHSEQHLVNLLKYIKDKNG